MFDAFIFKCLLDTINLNVISMVIVLPSKTLHFVLSLFFLALNKIDLYPYGFTLLLDNGKFKHNTYVVSHLFF